MTRPTPPPDQTCECPCRGAHKGKLRRVYTQDETRICYSWFCKQCYEDCTGEEINDAWPTDERGRFMTPTRCEKQVVA